MPERLTRNRRRAETTSLLGTVEYDAPDLIILILLLVFGGGGGFYYGGPMMGGGIGGILLLILILWLVFGRGRSI